MTVWPGKVTAIGVGAALLGVVLSIVGAVIGDLVSSAGVLIGGGIGLYGTLFVTCLLVSRRYGTGDLRADFGLRAEPGDVWRGLGATAAAWGVLIVVIAVLSAIDDGLAGNNTDALKDHQDSIGFLLAAGVLAVVAAPFFEELFFRGLLLGSLRSWLPRAAAVGVQAVLFGLAHAGGAEEALGNVGVIATTAVVGVAFGILATRHDRLGPSIAGHAWFNLLPVVVLFATR